MTCAPRRRGQACLRSIAAVPLMAVPPAAACMIVQPGGPASDPNLPLLRPGRFTPNAKRCRPFAAIETARA